MTGISHRAVAAGDGTVAVETAGSGEPVVLLHGWPQTRFAWREVMTVLAPYYQVIAVDLPGLGDSSPPPDYRKSTIAGLVWSAVRTVVPDGAVRLVGHDWGAIVGYLCAHAAGSEVSHLAVIEVVTPLEFAGLPLLIPGGNPAWHFLFHGVAGLPELLTEGREEQYLRWWFDHGSGKPGAISETAVAAYAAAYRRPGAMSSGFDYYRCVFDDIEETRAAATAKLTMPVLAVGGEHSFGPAVATSFTGVAENATGIVIPGAGHWIPDEYPAQLSAALLDFLA
jgi:pimeloyl-ACP methyl ester carboxylesterase